MKTFINKVLLIVGLIALAPVFVSATVAPSISCSPNYANDLVGKTITIKATISDATPGASYYFDWTGDEGLDATSSSTVTVDGNGSAETQITYSYETTGTKNINVGANEVNLPDSAAIQPLITIQDYDLEGSCSVNIYTDETLPDYTVACNPNTNRAVIGQNVTWSSGITGPLAPYTIVWSGDELSTTTSDSPVVSYTADGDKNATMVSFESRYGQETPIHNGKMANVACPVVNVVPENIHNPAPMSVTCSAPSVNAGDSATWTANITGGTSPFIITWSGSNGLSGTGASISKTYSSVGTETATLNVQDNAGQEIDVVCSNLSITAIPQGGGGGSTYTITVVPDQNGSVSPADSAPVVSGGDRTYSFTPNNGYNVADVIVDGVSQGAIDSYTFNNITSSHTVAVTFAKINPIVTTGAETNNGTNGGETPAVVAGAETTTGGNQGNAPTGNEGTQTPGTQDNGNTNQVNAGVAGLSAIIGSAYFWPLLILLIILVVAYIIYWLIKRRKEKKQA